jgi:hypothetical protein
MRGTGDGGLGRQRLTDIFRDMGIEQAGTSGNSFVSIPIPKGQMGGRESSAGSTGSKVG